MNTPERWQIHRHLAQNADERLQILTRTPERITLIGADADISRSLLAARYPQAAFVEYDPRADFLAAAAAARKSGLWQKLTGKIVPQHQQSLAEPLPEAATDMLWANLSLITADDLPAVFDNWARHLKTDGLLFFTHFGIDSLQDLIGRLNAEGIDCRAPTLIDMHDLGDMLFHHGFYDPVMDTAKLSLSYRAAATFWQDMETLGLWQALQLSDEAAARTVINHMWQSGKPVEITLETIHGHAVKKLLICADYSTAATTATVILATASVCSATSTSYSPTALKGPSGRRTLALAASTPAARIASAMSALVTEPNKRPSTPAFCATVMVWPSSFSWRACASAKISACLASSSARRASNSCRLAAVARLALPLGIRKLRA